MKSVGTRFLIPFGILAVLSSVFVFYQTYESSRKHAYELISQQAAMAQEFNLAIRGYAGEKIRPLMEKFVDKDTFIPETMSTSFISRSIFERVKQKFPGDIIRFSSDNPRNPVNTATPDEQRMMEYFRQNPQVNRRTEEIQIEGRRYLAHFSPMLLQKECLRCHSDPKDAPAELIKRYGPTAGFRRKLGDVVGLDTVAVPVEAINASLTSEMRSRSMILAAVFALLFGSIFYIFRFVVAKRLVAMASHFDEIAAHAESPWMVPVEVKGNDEISVVAIAFNKLVEQLRATHASLEQRVSERTEELRHANAQLQLELTERKRAEEALRKSEEKYRLLFDHAFDALVAIDMPSKRIIEVNEAFIKLYGYSKEEAIGMVATDLSAEPESSSLSLEGVSTTGGSYVPLLWHRKKDGTKFPVEISAGLLKLHDREVVCAFTKDITERQRTEAKLAKINECFLSFGTNFTENIQRLVKIGGEILEGTCALYNRLHGDRLFSLGQWQTPPDYQAVDLAEGHICFDVIRQSKDSPLVVRHLQTSHYAQSDPNVTQYNLQTYIGVAVYCQKVPVGSMCVVYQADINPTPENLNLLNIIGSAIGVEEERRQAAEELGKNISLLNAALESTADGLFIIDNDGKIVSYNQKFASLWQIPQSILETKDDDQALAFVLNQLKNPEEFLSRVRELYSQPETESFEVIEFKDGKIFERYSQPQRIGERIVGRVWSFRDVTARVQAQEALRDNEQFLTDVFNSIQDGLSISDPDLKVLRVNPAMEKFGYAGPIVGRKCYEVYHGRSASCDVCPVQQTLRTGKASREIVTEQLADGSHRFMEIYAFPQINRTSGQVQAVIEYVRDVTERQKAEEERLRFSKLESLATLAGGIAHDFNNILTAIIGNISLAMLDLQMKGENRERLTEAEKACLQAQNLSRQLLTFSKGGAPIKEVVSVKRLITESASFACRGSQVNYESSLPDNLWAVEADPGQISQVFQNLVINAIQAMPTGGMIKIHGENLEVAAESELPLNLGRYVKISIQDEGIGIAAEHLSRIFDPYFTTKQKGSGLGLATSYSIIKNHYGHISVESVLGMGTTFNVYLPASDRQVIQQPKADRELLSGKGQILVMDDEAMVREVLGQMLLKLGYEVKFAGDGAEAIEIFVQSEKSGDPVAAVILDLTVPGGMGGKEAMARLVKIDPQVKAIVSSGYSDDPIMADFQKYGFTAVIAKPYKISELGKVLNEALTGEQ